MARYISADELYEEIKCLSITCEGMNIFCEDAKQSILDEIKNQPTADVKEVVHGEWLNFYGDYSTAECSECAECYEVSSDSTPCEEFFAAFKQFYNFCPNCGADMRTEVIR